MLSDAKNKNKSTNIDRKCQNLEKCHHILTVLTEKTLQN